LSAISFKDVHNQIYSCTAADARAALLLWLHAIHDGSSTNLNGAATLVQL
jgi:hypothetical protein